MKIWLIIFVVCLVICIGLGLGLGLNMEKFDILKDVPKDMKIINTTEDLSYLTKCKKDFIMYSSNIHPRNRRLWAEEVKTKGPIIDYINKMNVKYNKPYIILGHDYDDTSFFPVNIPPHSLYLVASRTNSSNIYTYAIPQNDETFDGKFLLDPIPFKDKKDVIIWRGRMHGTEREKIIGSMNSELCVKNDINIYDDNNFVSKENQLKNKYILCIDGYGWPGSINWSLESNCCVFIRSDKHVWYYDLLDPWIDYVPIYSFDDLRKKLYIVHGNQKLAESIGINGSEKIKKIYGLQKIYLEMLFSLNDTHDEIMKKLKKLL